jgi:serine/threonine protein kinase
LYYITIIIFDIYYLHFLTLSTISDEIFIGVVHRDLKPENLLLSDPSDTAILKIADFGLSAVVFAREGVEGGYVAVDGNEEQSDSRQQQQKIQYGQLPSPIEIFQTSPAGPRQQQHHYSSPPGTPFPVPLRRLRSVVGSPHYIAPEIVNHGKPSTKRLLFFIQSLFFLSWAADMKSYLTITSIIIFIIVIMISQLMKIS